MLLVSLVALGLLSQQAVPQGLTWLAVSNAVTRSDVIEFTLDVAKTVRHERGDWRL